MKNARILFTAVILLLISISAMGENSTSSGGYTIHHNAIKTDFLDPKIAAAYDLQRSKFRGMVNISVIKEISGTTGKAVPADIEVQATNLMGVPKPLQLRQVREGEAIYYIGDFPVTDGEIVTFRLRVIPQDSKREIRARFSQQFYVD
jgi:hypothetical protein